MTSFTAAIVPAVFTAHPLSLRLLGSLFVLIGLLICYRKAGWVGRFVPGDAIVWDAEGRWFMSRGRQTWQVELCGDSWISLLGLVLRWKPVDGSRPRFNMLFTAADLGPAAFRRLRVRLQIEGLRATTATDSLLA